ncbi:MAG: alpha/beta fold hydrolase [Solirubrobacterales bacterium]
MILKTHEWGTAGGQPVICVHGLNQHGGVFKDLAGAVGPSGKRVIAVDIRGHGGSAHEGPWDIDTHVQDLRDTIESVGISRATWIGHSFGARVIATLASDYPDLVERLILLDAVMQVTGEYALRSAEMDRLDWNFGTAEGAVNALLSSSGLVNPKPGVVEAFVQSDLVRGVDGRLRFSHCPSAVVAAWSELAKAAPPVAKLPTLVIRPAVPLLPTQEQDLRYREELGSLMTVAVVPNGHNVLWESPSECASAIEAFLAKSVA